MTEFKRGDVVLINEPGNLYQDHVGIITGPDGYDDLYDFEVLTPSAEGDKSGDTEPGYFKAEHLRKLVVLDLAIDGFGAEQVGADIAQTLRRQSLPDSAFAKVASQIEAQTKPPRIDEPGWGAVVEAGVRQHDVRLRWTRFEQGTKRHWNCLDEGEYDRYWEDLVEPTLLREAADA